MSIEIHQILTDIEYLTGATWLDLASELEGMTEQQQLYTLQELKEMIVQKLMVRDLPEKRGVSALSAEETAEEAYAWTISRTIPPTIGSSRVF